MTHSKHTASLLRLLFPLAWFLRQQVSGYFDPTNSRNGFRLHNLVVETHSDVQTLLSCYDTCEKSQICYSVNYYWGGMICEFNNASDVSHPQYIFPSGNASYLTIVGKIPPYCTFNKSVPLGMESDLIPDSAVTASSHYGFGYAPYRGRLNHKPALPYDRSIDTASWCCAGNSAGQYLQIDFGRMVAVTMVATQGRPSWYQNQYVSKYRLAYKKDGDATLFDYKENNVIKVFTGNTHSEQVATNELKETIDVDLIRFVAVEWNSHICMRVEVYGCYHA